MPNIQYKPFAQIKAIASYLPKIELSNDILVKELECDWTAEDIYQKTGIKKRYISEKNECASDLAIKAVEVLFQRMPCKKEEIDFLIFCTQSPDYFLPTTACVLQDKLGLSTHCGALDINQGCSGFIYGLALTKGLIESGIAKNILFITSETYSKFINKRDKSTRTIFGDGAAATLIGVSDKCGIDHFVLGTDGSGANNLIVPVGGMRNSYPNALNIEKSDQDGNYRTDVNLYMNGAEIFNFTLKTIPSIVKELLIKSGYDLQDIDYFVFHQANKFMLDKLRKKLAIPKDKFFIDLQNGGNTVSSSIPIALKSAMKQNLIKDGDKVMLVGFGVGYSWGGVIWTKNS